jgi:hypothetical protein
MFMLAGLISCNIDRDRAVERDKFEFKTGDDTELFFKNVRQSDYELEENEAAGLRVFRHENIWPGDTIPVIVPAIVMNVLKDEAYILLEPSNGLEDEDPLTVVLTGSGQADTVKLELPNRENNLEFATRIYEHLQQGGTFRVGIGGSFTDLLTDSRYRESFRITMSDYYRLTRIY